MFSSVSRRCGGSVRDVSFTNRSAASIVEMSSRMRLRLASWEANIKAVVGVLTGSVSVVVDAVPVQVQQVMVIHSVGRIAGIGPVPVVRVDDAKHCPVRVVGRLDWREGKIRISNWSFRRLPPP